MNWLGEGDMHRVRAVMVGVVVALGVGGCAKERAATASTRETAPLLTDLSSLAIGRGFDRAFDTSRDECFERNSAAIAAVQEWEAAGFSAYSAIELRSKLQTAITVGLKVHDPESHLGSQLAEMIGASGEFGYYAMLSRFTARREEAGRAGGPTSACDSLAAGSSNGIGDFVSTCGDSALTRKEFGGHVLVAWRRNTSRGAVNDLMASALGVQTEGGTLDPLAGLETLRTNGLGAEEVVLEAHGMPCRHRA